jgi:hypothetical protein
MPQGIVLKYIEIALNFVAIFSYLKLNRQKVGNFKKQKRYQFYYKTDSIFFCTA